jgi:hypothetical protein
MATTTSLGLDLDDAARQAGWNEVIAVIQVRGACADVLLVSIQGPWTLSCCFH